MVKKPVMCLAILTQITSVTDRQTDRTAATHTALACSALHSNKIIHSHKIQPYAFNCCKNHWPEATLKGMEKNKKKATSCEPHL